jgi:hypothetical protein
MKYTTNDYRIDSKTKTIEVYKPTNFVEFYRTLVKVWSRHTPFCAELFPSAVTNMFPVTPKTVVPIGVIKW